MQAKQAILQCIVVWPWGEDFGKFCIFDPKDTLDHLILSLFKMQNVKNEHIFGLKSTLDR